ncbi:S8 family serine peptidase [Leptolyngbya ohadii]|uniref:S8 family serine peptidase n=1 Tax=Leptolyngbya ohadii TaxID=1962290 RepID=UPI000B5A070B|nr:S8 family serine peptidase [Leptolyngbya ohadii]
MVWVQYGGKNGRRYEFEISQDHVAVRTVNRAAMMSRRSFEIAPLSQQAYQMLSQNFELNTRFRHAGVEVLKAKSPQPDTSLRDAAREMLNAEPEIEFAGRVLVDVASQTPILYSENFFLKFFNDQLPEACEALIAQYGLTVKRPLEYARNAYFVAAPEGTGLATFEIAERLLQEDIVEFCHPELVSDTRARRVFPDQWHLAKTTINGRVIDASANVEAAWELSRGTGAIIAVIDDGVDIDHEEFRSSGKIVAPRDVTRKTNDPRPGRGEDHGTACAGVACANGNFGASGVAPEAKLIPIRLASGLRSQAEADSFVWAAQNGADVISCSWGPPDGAWWDPNDPLHQQVVPLADSTRLAIDYAVTQGRNGKGCVVLFAAGNGNESVDNDGYASYRNVIAVAASNDRGVRSVYSDFGKAIWCTFPSNDGEPSLTSGIWTTDRSGTAGYNPGNATQGDRQGNYTNAFGGTSSSTPGVAGVVALILARNPDLRWDQVREILRQSCDRIDPEGGKYDANGRSPFYGYGRVNARKAVELALPSSPDPRQTYRIAQDIPIRDFQTARLSLSVGNPAPIRSIQVTIDVEHTYIGDLVVMLVPPAALNGQPIILHDRAGGGTDNLKRTYDTANIPALQAMIGKNPAGTWTLEITDKASRDTGMLRSFAIEIDTSAGE